MNVSEVMSIVWAIGLLVLVVLVARARRTGRRRGGIGPAAAGAMYGLLTEDKQRAIEVIVEKGAEKRRPEFPDDNLPELEDPRRRRGQN